MDKRQFVTLDGLRGVAALLVVGLHARPFFIPAQFASAYLAVDLFFVLSGFVLEHAYANRFLSGLRGVDFLGARIARLYPLYLIGALIGTVSGIIAWWLGAGELEGAGVVVASVAALLMLPSPTFAQVGLLYVFNVPGWSLFLELCVNAVYGSVWRHLTSFRLCWIIGVAAILLSYITVQAGWMDLGSTWSTLAGGSVRVTFSFFAGVLIRRHMPRSRGASPLSWLVLATVVPLLMAAPSTTLRPFYDLGLALLLFPLLIIAGASVEPSARSARVFEFLGAISFPVYVVHYPIVELARRVIRMARFNPESTAPVSGLILMVALIAIAFLLSLVDSHARRMLKLASANVRRRQASLR